MNAADNDQIAEARAALEAADHMVEATVGIRADYHFNYIVKAREARARLEELEAAAEDKA